MRFGEKVSTAENTLYGKHVHLEEEIILWGGGGGGGAFIIIFSSSRVQGNVKGSREMSGELSLESRSLKKKFIEYILLLQKYPLNSPFRLF